MKEFASSKTTGVYDVDCTTEGKPLCDSNGVKGFPTLMHGDPADLQAYEGGRDYAALKKFAEGLKPLCSPKNMDLCDEDGKAKIALVQKMTDAEIDAVVTKAEADEKEAEETFTTEVDKLQKTYKALQDAKETTVAAIKAQGIGLMKSVKAARAGGKEEL